jgi:hypothetical protein
MGERVQAPADQGRRRLADFDIAAPTDGKKDGLIRRSAAPYCAGISFKR